MQKHFNFIDALPHIIKRDFFLTVAFFHFRFCVLSDIDCSVIFVHLNRRNCFFNPNQAKQRSNFQGHFVIIISMKILRGNINFHSEKRHDTYKNKNG